MLMHMSIYLATTCTLLLFHQLLCLFLFSSLKYIQCPVIVFVYCVLCELCDDVCGVCCIHCVKDVCSLP